MFTQIFHICIYRDLSWNDPGMYRPDNDEHFDEGDSHSLKKSPHNSPIWSTESDRQSPSIIPEHEMFLKICSKNYRHDNVKIVNELNFKTFSLKESSTSNTSSTSEKVDFCLNIIYPLSSKLIETGSYYDQTLVVIIYDTNISFKNVLESKLDADQIKSILLIQRSDKFQAYRLSNLSNCPHFTLLTADLPTFVSDLNHILKKPVDVVFIARSVPSYNDPNICAMVLNSDSKTIDCKTITNASTALFEAGLGDFFSLQDQGRGDVIGFKSKKRTAKERTIPTLTLGYSNMDANRYKSNRISILGHIKPFIRDGGLSTECKAAYLLFTKHIMESKLCEGAFDLSFLDPALKILREQMISEFYAVMGGNPDDDHNSWFLTESNANLVVQQLAPHCDTQNSSIPGLNDVVVFITHPPVKALLAKSSSSSKHGIENKTDIKSKVSFSLHDYVKSKGYHSTFPYTRVHYMKSMMDSHVKKLHDLAKLKKKNKLSCIFVWGLTETLNTHFDYRGSVFDRIDFPKYWETQCKDLTQQGSFYRDPCLELPPAFDKMGYYSLLLEVWNFLITRFLKKPTVIDAINYAFYCSWSCNGTILPWRICFDIFEDTSTANAVLLQSSNFFNFLQNMDEIIAQNQDNETGDDSPRRSGSCRPSRSQYSIAAMTTDWSTKSEELLEIVNVAFYEKDPKVLAKNWKSEAKTIQGHDLLAKYLLSYPGIGSFYAHILISMLSLLGICPLRTYTNALISDDWNNGSGTVKLVSACVPEDEREGKTPFSCIKEVTKDFNTIMRNDNLTEGLTENMGCEKWRTYVGKLETLNLTVKTNKKETIDLLMDDSNHGKSGKVDIYMWMRHKEGIQNVFHYSTSCKGLTCSTPGIVMRCPSDWEKGPMLYSDWTGLVSKYRKVPNLVYWAKDKKHKTFQAKTLLVVSESLKKLYLPQREHRTRKQPNRYQDEEFKGKKKNTEDMIVIESSNSDSNEDEEKEESS